MPNENYGNTIRILGWISIIVGVIIAIYLMAKASDAMFGGETMAIIGVLFGMIFVMLGIIGVGVGQLLLTSSGDTRQKSPIAHRTTMRNTESNEIVCPNCGEVYASNFSGQFCESCGALL